MSEINWNILQPVDVGAQMQQGFATGWALVKQINTNNALRAYAAAPDDPNAYNALAAFDPQTAASMQQQHLLRRKALIEQQERERRTALGERYTRDPAGAREEAVAAGDFDLAEQFGKLDEAQQKRTAEFWQRAGPVAWSLKQERDPAKRTALWQEAKPILASIAGNPALLDRIDPLNDTQLDAAIATSQKIGDLITQSRVDWQSVPGEGGSAFAVDYFGRPVGSQNPYAGGGGSAPAPASNETIQQGRSTVASVFSGAGLPAPVIAGFLGNFDVEGGWGGAEGDGGKARGIGQWHPDRIVNYERAVGRPFDPSDHEGQARFTLWEMQNPEAAGMTVEQRDAILNARSAGEAAELIDKFYERSSGEHRQKRIAAAERLAGGGAPVRVASKVEADKLPSGATFIAPDGSIRRKP